MRLELYYQLSHNSKKSLKRRTRGYTYTPSNKLISRLATKNNMSKDAVVNALYKEREFILKHPEYFY